MFKMECGTGSWLGARLDAQGCHFGVWASGASRVELCLFDNQEQELIRLVLPRTVGQHHYGYVPGVKAGQYYGYRVHGKAQPGLLLDPDKLLIDPYARALSRPLIWHDELYAGDSAALIPKSVVVSDAFDWEGVSKPDHDVSQLVIYETHVKGMTMLHPEVPQALRGTYLGMCHPALIRHLKELGITAVQLLPTAAFMSEMRLEKLGLTNYWGYNPIAFFAPEPRYAWRDAVTEFKTMVRELHRAGLEVILDVVYNHTAESGSDGPTLSFKGFDNAGYYDFEQGAQGPDYQRYLNVTGCGNSFNLDHPNALRLVLDALRYWVSEMQIDGFRFDLAVTLAREANEFEPMGAFFKAIMADPVLAGARLIAEPWDVGPFGYRLGQFPSQWSEINDRYRDTVRAFWRGDSGRMGDFATRLLGSRDIFPKGWRSPHTSVNYLCYHDGFTLDDLVSYNQRQNQVNGEENRDGSSNNLSCNYGVEGPTLDPRISNLRQQQKRNFIATLLLSQGIPHFLGGDEMGRSQLGNNNAYCQDNRISWVNWQHSPDDERLLHFTRQMMQLRAESRVFSSLQLEGDTWYGECEPLHQVTWYHPDGHILSDQDWSSPMAQAFALDIGVTEGVGERWLVLFNASDYDIQFRLPLPCEGREWLQVIDTATSDGLAFLPDDIKRQVAVGRAHALKLLACKVIQLPLSP